MPIKRLARKTICFSKSVFMHNTGIGLFMNRYEFAGPVQPPEVVVGATVTVKYRYVP